MTGLDAADERTDLRIRTNGIGFGNGIGVGGKEPESSWSIASRKNYQPSRGCASCGLDVEEVKLSPMDFVPRGWIELSFVVKGRYTDILVHCSFWPGAYWRKRMSNFRADDEGTSRHG